MLAKIMVPLGILQAPWWYENKIKITPATGGGRTKFSISLKFAPLCLAINSYLVTCIIFATISISASSSHAL
jgi:hypothetical protein